MPSCSLGKRVPRPNLFPLFSACFIAFKQIQPHSPSKTMNICRIFRVFRVCMLVLRRFVSSATGYTGGIIHNSNESNSFNHIIIHHIMHLFGCVWFATAYSNWILFVVVVGSINIKPKFRNERANVKQCLFKVSHYLHLWVSNTYRYAMATRLFEQ